MDERLERAKERAWREVAAIDAAHAAGELDDAGWHAAMAALVVPASAPGSSTCPDRSDGRSSRTCSSGSSPRAGGS